MAGMLDWTTYPTCPYCGGWEESPQDYNLNWDGDEAVIKCGCGKSYRTVMCVDVSYQSTPIEGGENADSKPES